MNKYNNLDFPKDYSMILCKYLQILFYEEYSYENITRDDIEKALTTIGQTIKFNEIYLIKNFIVIIILI